nr:RecName: Full=Inorganic pyrophosphatase; AltName: Full=Pyrophosphate phospho-hydrolase; Short=PPase [Euglena gracilis]
MDTKLGLVEEEAAN